MRGFWIFTAVVLLAGGAIWQLSRSEKEVLFPHPPVVDPLPIVDLSLEARGGMEACRSNPHDAELYGEAIALMNADLNSCRSEACEGKLGPKISAFKSEMGLKLLREHEDWLAGPNASMARSRLHMIDSYLETSPSMPALRAAQLQCKDVLWMIDVGQYSAGAKRAGILFSSEYDKEAITQFIAKVERICDLWNKPLMNDFLNETASAFDAFVKFDSKWSKVWPLYQSTGGKHPPHLRRNASLRLTPYENRQYDWYKNEWMKEFGKIDLSPY
jgi:hypothetical protein